MGGKSRPEFLQGSKAVGGAGVEGSDVRHHQWEQISAHKGLRLVLHDVLQAARMGARETERLPFPVSLSALCSLHPTSEP